MKIYLIYFQFCKSEVECGKVVKEDSCDRISDMISGGCLWLYNNGSVGGKCVKKAWLMILFIFISFFFFSFLFFSFFFFSFF
jgi:hypothetical protein